MYRESLFSKENNNLPVVPLPFLKLFLPAALAERERSSMRLYKAI